MKSLIDDATVKTEKIEDRLEDFGSPKIMVVGTGGAGCRGTGGFSRRCRGGDRAPEAGRF